MINITYQPRRSIQICGRKESYCKLSNSYLFNSLKDTHLGIMPELRGTTMIFTGQALQ